MKPNLWGVRKCGRHGGPQGDVAGSRDLWLWQYILGCLLLENSCLKVSLVIGPWRHLSAKLSSGKADSHAAYLFQDINGRTVGCPMAAPPLLAVSLLAQMWGIRKVLRPHFSLSSNIYQGFSSACLSECVEVPPSQVSPQDSNSISNGTFPSPAWLGELGRWPWRRVGCFDGEEGSRALGCPFTNQGITLSALALYSRTRLSEKQNKRPPPQKKLKYYKKYKSQPLWWNKRFRSSRRYSTFW